MRVVLILVLVLFVSCASVQFKYQKHLMKDKYKWENREKALEHYLINLNNIDEFYLIETFVGWNNGHWGCFYIDDNSYCFSRPDIIDSVGFNEFKYDNFIVESLKKGSLDTLIKLSCSPKHVIISPASNYILTRFKDGVIKSYTVKAFDVNPDMSPDNL